MTRLGIIILISDIKIEGIEKYIAPTEDYLKDYNNAVRLADGKYFMIIDDNLINIFKIFQSNYYFYNKKGFVVENEFITISLKN